MKPLDALLLLVCLLFSTGVIVDRRWAPERAQHRAVVRFQQKALDEVEDRLQAYAERRGHYPTTEEGLDAVPGLRDALSSGDFAPARRFLERFPDVRTIHGVPYVYENRLGHPQGTFEASPARGDRKNARRWSRKVDEGVFVSSLGLRDDVQTVFGQQWLDALLYFGGGVLLLLTILYAVARNRRSADRVRGINAMLIVGVSVLLTLIVLVSSQTNPARTGAPRELGALRGDVLEAFLEVQRRFAANGGISTERLAALERTLRADFAGVPGAVPPEGSAPSDAPPEGAAGGEPPR